MNDLIEFLRARFDDDEGSGRSGDLGDWGEVVLREVEAKRKLIAAYEADTEGLRYPTHEAGMVDGLEWAMQFLALPYADHPDYRQEWAP